MRTPRGICLRGPLQVADHRVSGQGHGLSGQWGGGGAEHVRHDDRVGGVDGGRLEQRLRLELVGEEGVELQGRRQGSGRSCESSNAC